LTGIQLVHESQIVRERNINWVHPHDRSITEPLDTGLCIYCQLILSPDVPIHTQHHPNFQLLLDSSKCEMCKVLTSSLSQGCPGLRQMYNSGYPPLYDRTDKTSAIFVESTQYSRHTQIVARCSLNVEFRGKPIVWSTEKRLGECFSSVLIEPHSSSSLTSLISGYWVKYCSLYEALCPEE
jgi:hypothetical protein